MSLDAAHSPALAGICFDAYGGLFDVSPLLRDVDALVGNGAGIAFQQRLVTWTWHATAGERWSPFEEIARTALLACASEWSAVLHDRDVAALLSRLHRLPLADGAFDVVHTLAPAQLAVLSNGSRDALAALVDNAGIAHQILHLLGTDQVQRYKPSPQVYALAPVAFGVSSDRVLLVSANDWDVAGAATAGLRTAWVSHGRPQTRVLGIGADLVVESLRDLPDALAGRGLVDLDVSDVTLPGRSQSAGSSVSAAPGLRRRQPPAR